MKATSKFEQLAEQSGREEVAAILEWLHAQYRLAEDARRSPWDYSVELSRLRERGVSAELLGALVEAGWIEHRIETTPARAKRRQFRQGRGESWEEGSRFVLTETGVTAALEALRWMVDGQREGGRKRRRPEPMPRYDAETGELWYGEVRLKRFPAGEAFTVVLLRTFEQAAWTEEDIDNPLPGYDEAVKAKRLREAVRNLNYDLTRIRFEVARGSRKLRWLRTKES